jgi:hypothetical protein
MRNRRRWRDAVASRSIGTRRPLRPRREARPLGILNVAAVVLGEKVPVDLARKRGAMSEWKELTWEDAMRRGYQALRSGEALYEEIDAEQGRSNLDIEKHLRRAELRLAQANAWLAMARELGWQRDDYGSRAR